MQRARLVAAVSLALVAATPPGPGAKTGDLRSRTLLRYECRSQLARREVTLFANGTIRLREAPGPELEEETTRGPSPWPEMTLAELGPEELRGYVARLRQEVLEESDTRRHGVGGEWVESCVLELGLREGEGRRFEFGRFDALDLSLSRVVGIAEELWARVEEVKDRPRQRLPADYEVRTGDVLRRADGVVFKVVAFTSDGSGVELQGVNQPLTIYVPRDEIRSQFPVLVSRRGER